MNPYQYEDKLESERLITRMLHIDDIKAWEVFFESPEATAYIPKYNSTDKKVKARGMIEKQLLRYETKRYGLQVLTDKKTNQFVGICGLLLQDIEGHEQIEIGYHLFKQFWGKGYATEAAKLFKHYAFSNNLCDSVISIIDIHNIRSQKVAMNNGMTREKQLHWAEHDIYIYRVNKN